MRWAEWLLLMLVIYLLVIAVMGTFIPPLRPMPVPTFAEREEFRRILDERKELYHDPHR